MKRLVILVIPLLLSLSRPALAQTSDEPGVGGPPPPTPPATTPPAASPAPPTSAPSDADPVARARAGCRAGVPCPHFAALVRTLLTGLGGLGAPAAGVLGSLGDPRAVAPLALATAYGPTGSVSTAARDGLRELVSRPSARDVAARMGKTNPDPVVRNVIATALGGETALERTDVVVPPRGATPPSRLADPETTRLVYGPTAHGREKGVWSWTIYNVGYWNFDYGLSDHVEIGMQTVPPVGVLAFMPHMKLTTRLGEKAAIGVRLFGGVVYPYIQNDDDLRIGVFGGAPVLTIGDSDLLFNISVLVAGMVMAETKTMYLSFGTSTTEETEYTKGWSAMPNVGLSWRFARRLKLNLELYVPLMDDHPVGNAKLWVLLYGLRFFGESIYGDVSFAMPFWPDMGEVMKYVPTGFPLLTFGFQW